MYDGAADTRNVGLKNLEVLDMLMMTKQVMFYWGLLLFLQVNNMAAQYEFQFVTFRCDVRSTYLEIFCQMPKQELTMTIVLSDTGGVPVASQTHKIAAESADKPGAESVLVRYVFVAKPGDYSAQVVLTNRKTNAYSSFTRQVRLPNYGREGLCLSDLQFSSSIVAAPDMASLLVKNGRKIIPNAIRAYGGDANILYLYFEAYNLEQRRTGGNRWLDVRCTILDDTLAVESVRIRQPFEEASLAVDLGIPVHDLPTGRYRLLVRARSPDGQVANKEVSFTVIEPFCLDRERLVEMFIPH